MAQIQPADWHPHVLSVLPLMAAPPDRHPADLRHPPLPLIPDLRWADFDVLQIPLDHIPHETMRCDYWCVIVGV